MGNITKLLYLPEFIMHPMYRITFFQSRPWQNKALCIQSEIRPKSGTDLAIWWLWLNSWFHQKLCIGFCLQQWLQIAKLPVFNQTKTTSCGTTTWDIAHTMLNDMCQIMFLAYQNLRSLSNLDLVEDAFLVKPMKGHSHPPIPGGINRLVSFTPTFVNSPSTHGCNIPGWWPF